MKILKECVEVEGEGLEALLGEWVQLWCVNYIYAGLLTGVNDDDVILSHAGVVYETGPMKSETFKDFQPVYSPDGKLRVRTGAIESYGLAPKLVKP